MSHGYSFSCQYISGSQKIRVWRYFCNFHFKCFVFFPNQIAANKSDNYKCHPSSSKTASLHLGQPKPDNSTSLGQSSKSPGDAAGSRIHSGRRYCTDILFPSPAFGFNIGPHKNPWEEEIQIPSLLNLWQAGGLFYLHSMQPANNKKCVMSWCSPSLSGEMFLGYIWRGEHRRLSASLSIWASVGRPLFTSSNGLQQSLGTSACFRLLAVCEKAPDLPLFIISNWILPPSFIANVRNAFPDQTISYYLMNLYPVFLPHVRAPKVAYNKIKEDRIKLT